MLFFHNKNTLLEVPGMPKSMKGWSQTYVRNAFGKVMQKITKTKAKRSQNRAETGSDKVPGRKSVQDEFTSIYWTNLGLSWGCPGVEKGPKAQEAPKARMALTLFLYKRYICILVTEPTGEWHGPLQLTYIHIYMHINTSIYIHIYMCRYIYKYVYIYIYIDGYVYQ